MIRYVVFGMTALSLLAQTQHNYMFKLDSGAMVLYQVYNEVATKADTAWAKAQASGNHIQRLMVNGNGVPWLGYQLDVDPVAGRMAFQLSIRPIPGVPFFAQAPVARTIENGDRVLLDVLEQPSTGYRIFDTFQVGMKGTPMQIMPHSRAIPQPAPTGSTIRLQNPRFSDGRQLVLSTQGTVTGTRVGLDVPGAGRFLFSTAPEPGYRMEAIVEGSSLRFVTGEKGYEVVCTGIVPSHAGTWYVWVKSLPGTSDAMRAFVP